jgi:Gly-Xaa carboxypeptidase
MALKTDIATLPMATRTPQSSKSLWTRRLLIGVLIVPCFLLGTFISSHWNDYRVFQLLTTANRQCHHAASTNNNVCAQVGPLYPSSSKNAETWKDFGKELEKKRFKELAIERLSGLIQIPSESYDNMPPPGQDPRWETMGQVHDYLAVAFPLM